jgi:Domain of unknown function (DUF4384)
MAMARMNSIREERPGGASGRRPFRHASALVLLIAAAAAGWFAADRLLTEVSVMVVSTDHGPMPTLRSGETVAVQVETSADKFVYCYYMDGSRQVARIFPNRFQPDALVPAGKMVQIPPGPEPERPFNIRLETAGQLEAVTCLASSTEVDTSQIDGTDVEDLTPIPGLELQDLVDAFGRLSATGARSQTIPINVMADTDSLTRPR